ncbi:hypothetical protein ONZ45_g10399 [Pleurotus djamor]|nr:hypothetical protein ONZ45_g17447 [Pleurotus djamor]KAJ8507212.1 hypothetical protein ONZ45_g10399 [Pleurotus djamor]
MFATSFLVLALGVFYASALSVQHHARQLGEAPIHPNGDTSSCLTIVGPTKTNGAGVQVLPCAQAPFPNWWLSVLPLGLDRGSTKILLAGSGYCLAKGADGAPQSQACSDNDPAQQWFYTADNRIALQDQG